MTEWNSETAEWYAANYGEYATNSLAVDQLDLQTDAVIVDIGCGTGSALRHAASRVTQGSLIGIDPVPKMIEIARERTVGHPGSARIEFREGSAEELPVADDLASFVFAFDSLDHWQDVDQGFTEARRVLRPGGTLVIVKDGGVPGAEEARRAFIGIAERAGFIVTEQREINAQDISFALWTCAVSED